MNSHKQQLMAALCASLGPDDGIDPRRTRRAEHATNTRNHHQKQLCRQVERALCMALGESGDPLLAYLEVSQVRAVSNSNRLLVTVTPRLAANEYAQATLQAALQRSSGLLRTIIAAQLTRKRVPELVFEIADYQEHTQ